MSKMSDLHLEIQERILNGELPENIAIDLNIPVHWVYEVEYSLHTEENQ